MGWGGGGYTYLRHIQKCAHKKGCKILEDSDRYDIKKKTFLLTMKVSRAGAHS